jgi:hypothetical protein
MASSFKQTRIYRPRKSVYASLCPNINFDNIQKIWDNELITSHIVFHYDNKLQVVAPDQTVTIIAPHYDHISYFVFDTHIIMKMEMDEPYEIEIVYMSTFTTERRMVSKLPRFSNAIIRVSNDFVLFERFVGSDPYLFYTDTYFTPIWSIIIPITMNAYGILPDNCVLIANRFGNMFILNINTRQIICLDRFIHGIQSIVCQSHQIFILDGKHTVHIFNFDFSSPNMLFEMTSICSTNQPFQMLDGVHIDEIFRLSPSSVAFVSNVSDNHYIVYIWDDYNSQWRHHTCKLTETHSCMYGMGQIGTNIIVYEGYPKRSYVWKSDTFEEYFIGSGRIDLMHTPQDRHNCLRQLHGLLDSYITKDIHAIVAQFL